MTGQRRRMNGARLGGFADPHAPARRIEPVPVPVPNGFPAGLLALSDAELEAVMFFAHPMAPDERSRFLAELAERVAGAGEVGLGLLNRICREIQPRHLTPPDTVAVGRWGRDTHAKADSAQRRWAAQLPKDD
jgi:hypothetical protein